MLYKDLRSLTLLIAIGASKMYAQNNNMSIVNGGKADELQGSNLQKSNTFEGIILEQNNPNPFSETTAINYYIPKEYSGASELLITDEKGRTTLQKIEVCIGKPCQIIVSSKDLPAGVYIYAININGRIVKSNKMMVIK